MFQEIRQILDNNVDHTYILSIALEEIKQEDFVFESLRDIIFIDIIKNTFEEKKVYELISQPSTYELIRKIILNNLQFYKTDDYLILALQVKNPLESSNLS